MSQDAAEHRLGAWHSLALWCEKSYKARHVRFSACQGAPRRRRGMAKFKVVTPAGVSYGAPAASYELEMEALRPLEAVDDALGDGSPLGVQRVIDGLER